jgi:site-specific DNA-methyltransferase (adenine-specific)
MKKNDYNPDILDTLANLSSDEVFTSPRIVNSMLDLLPQDIFKSKDTTFLDPSSKSGVFLREIVVRLNKGLENQIVNIQDRINHILKNQVFGISITNLTALTSRRTLYCAKNADSKFSISTAFDNPEGNIIYKRIPHKWKNKKCIYCGANQDEYDRDKALESHAYYFIHRKDPKEIFNMKFDVIIGNPPYQLNTGGAQAQATPLYHKFIEQAKKLQPRYISMIVPSRWFTGGFGLNSFRDEMLNDNRLRVIHDFLDASECFPGVEIKGGVNYFLWDRDNPGLCKIVTHENGNITSESERPLLEKNSDIFIRYNGAVEILHKIHNFNEVPFSEMVSSQRPFGFPTNFEDYSSIKSNKNNIKVYANKKQGYIPLEKVNKNTDLVDKWKVYVPKAIGSGDSKTDVIKPILGEPNSVCTETYVMLGTYNTELEAKNAISYIETKFFHFLVTLIKNTQDALARVYRFVPTQNFNESWDDMKLYKKYSLSDEEIKFIEGMVWPKGDNNE